jgi:hypothetical protein
MNFAQSVLVFPGATGGLVSPEKSIGFASNRSEFGTRMVNHPLIQLDCLNLSFSFRFYIRRSLYGF